MLWNARQADLSTSCSLKKLEKPTRGRC